MSVSLNLLSITPNSGSSNGGTSVVINFTFASGSFSVLNSSYFSNTLSVHFGSVILSVTPSNSTLSSYSQSGSTYGNLTCTTPANVSGTSQVTIYNGATNISTNFLSYTYLASPPCFKKDSKILTDQGYKLIQDLRKGDLVKTLKHGFLPIDMIGFREIYHPALEERVKEQLYKYSKTVFEEVFEDLIITGCHSVLVDILTQEQGEKTMEDFGRIFQTDDKIRLMAYLDKRASIYENQGNYTIYHFALENKDYYGNYGIYANGLLVETCSKRYLLEHSNMELLF